RLRHRGRRHRRAHGRGAAARRGLAAGNEPDGGRSLILPSTTRAIQGSVRGGRLRNEGVARGNAATSPQSIQWLAKPLRAAAIAASIPVSATCLPSLPICPFGGYIESL